MFLYDNNGLSFRAVDDDYVANAAAGEVLFIAHPTTDELSAAFGNTSIIADAASKRAFEVNNLYDDKIAAGFTYEGNVFQIDPEAISNMQTIMIAFAIGQTNPQNGVWRSANNVNVAMDDTAVKAFIVAAQAYVTALLCNSWALKDALTALTSLDAIAAYDITTGWPS